MEYLKVKNWEKLQHYKNRNPTWIKFYTALLDDADFETLPDSSKLHLILLWLLAARKGNRLQNDEAKLTKKLPIYGQVNLQPLIDGGWLIPTNDSKMIASCYHQKRREEKRREDKKTQLFPIIGKICSEKDCHMPAVYKSTNGTYDHYYCPGHMPEKVKEKYE